MSLNTTQTTSTGTDGAVEPCYMTHIVVLPSTSYMINSVIGCIVNAFLAISGTILNTLVVCVFWKTPRLRSKVSYFMIMVLSCIDMCVSIIVHPFHLINSIAEMTETSKCFYKMFYETSALIFCGMSFLTLFVMNLERYLSIVRPLLHRRHVTKRKCLMLSSLFWIVCLITGLCFILKLTIRIIITTLVFSVIVATFFIYVSIFYVARKRLKPREMVRTISGGQGNLVVVNLGKEEAIHSSKTVSFLHELQMAKMCLLVVFSSIFLDLPNAVVFGMYTDRITTLNVVVQVKIWTVTLVAMNSTVNSLIFFWSNDKLRREGWKLCKALSKH